MDVGPLREILEDVQTKAAGSLPHPPCKVLLNQGRAPEWLMTLWNRKQDSPTQI